MQTEVDVIIEIAKGSHIKYEYDKVNNMLVCDRILHTPFKYPFNYGFIPNTLSEDKDPLDAVILMEDELIPGCRIRCKILGYLDTEDDAGNDPKLIVCPIDKIDPTWKDIDDLFNKKIHEHTLDKIKYFFKHYKDLEKKTVTIKEFHGSNYANKIYEESINRFRRVSYHKNKITDYYPVI
jgi:inorganic pyrophosphatase